jgi:hypothetical protein
LNEVTLIEFKVIEPGPGFNILGLAITIKAELIETIHIRHPVAITDKF